MIKISENTLFADRYQFQRLLGRGGFSEVWLAVDKMTNLEIAVKVYAPGQGMDTDGMKDFCKELSQVYNLNHTNLLKPQHVDSWEGMPYLVMTYCPQGSCHRMVGAMTEEQVWKMLHDVASGLAYLHEQGIIHQDIKPDNILVDPLGNYVITDFGISVQSRSTLRKSMNIATGSGTTAYMGPERFSKDPTPLKASDIWSLGATAYELITGNAPFGEIGGGMQKGGADLPTIKQDISAELRMVLAKMLALETWDRPTAEQLVQWTENPQKINFTIKDGANESVSVTQRSTTQTPVDSKQHNKKVLIIGLVVALVLALSGGTIGYFVHQKKEAQKREIAIKRQISLKDQCEDHIYKMSVEDISNLDVAVQKLRELEACETTDQLSSYLGKSFLPEEMEKFRKHLTKLKKINQAKLERDYADFDKSGPTYTSCERRIRILDRVISEIEASKKQSPSEIHIISDDL